MGQNTSALERFKSEVVLAVQDNNARRLYHLFILATRHQLGELTVIPPTSSSSSSSNVLVQLVKQGGQAATGAAVSVEEYMRSVMASQPAPNSTYLAFHDDHNRQANSSSSSQQSQQHQSNHSFPSSAPHQQSTSGAWGSITSWFGKSSTPPASAAASPAGGYVNFSSAQSVPPINQHRPSISSSSSSINTPPSQPQPSAQKRGSYAPPSMTAEMHEQAQKTAQEVSAPMANLMSTTSSPHSMSPHSHSPSHQSSPTISTLGSPSHSSSATSYTYSSGPVSISAPPPPPPQTNPFASSSTAEFSRSTIPVNINTLYVGSEPLLHYAAKQDQTSIIHLLYQAGADVELADMNGWSALIHAAAAGSVRAVRALLDIGADALAKTKTGLTASQCTTSGEIRKELEVEEDERRQSIESQVQVMTATRSIPLLSSSGMTAPPSVSFGSASGNAAAFHLALYEIRVPIEIRSGNRFEVLYRCPPTHSELDCLCVYSVDSDKVPWQMRPRMGASFTIPQTIGGEKYRRMALVAESKVLPPGSYRLVYYDATQATFPAASNLFSVIAQPSSNATSTSSSLASWFDPNAWSNPAAPSQHVDISNPNQSSTPIIFHPDFQSLSSTQPANLAAYLRPVPPYFLFSFHLNPVAVRLALELDPELGLCRDSLVPVRLKEREFWVAYFYRMVALDWRSVDEEVKAARTAGTGVGVRSETFVEDGPIEADTPRSAAAAAAAAAASGAGGSYVPPGASDSGSGERYLASLMGGGGGAAAVDASVGAAANGGYVPPSLNAASASGSYTPPTSHV